MKKIRQSRKEVDMTVPFELTTLHNKDYETRDKQQRKLGKEYKAFGDYLKTGEIRYTHCGLPVFTNETIVNKNNGICWADGLTRPSSKGWLNRLLGLGGVILPRGGNGFKHLAVLNADADYTLVGYAFTRKLSLPVVSFTCLGRFYYGKHAATDRNVDKVSKMFASGRLDIKDFTADEQIKLSDVEKKIVKSGNPKEIAELKAPGFGFTLVARAWHRPSTVVVRDTETSQTYLVGQDENVYFGCELPRPVATVAMAFKVLTPPQARKPGTLRQGEWFAVPINAKQVPSVKNSLGFSSSVGGISLPVDSADSDFHRVGPAFGSELDSRIGKDGRIFVKGFCMRHSAGEHEALCGVKNTWYAFYRNTAVRSFNEQGVD